jgi:acyl carrier protein
MTGVDIENRLKRVVLDHLGRPLPIDELRRETSLYGRGLGFSSLDLVSLLVAVEETFDIFFEGEEMSAAAQTFGALLAAVECKVNASAADRDGLSQARCIAR